MTNLTTCSLVLAMAWLVAGCGEPDTLDAFPEWVANEAVYCSSACVEARHAAHCDWDIPESGIEACLDANCSSAPDSCGGTSTLWEPSCYVDCVRGESQEVQDAVARNLECAVPPACR